MHSPRILLVALLLHAGVLRAQSEVQVSSFGFSEGVYPTLSFLFEGTDNKYVESFWKDELKKISASVSTKKEVIGMSALIPQVSPDTVRVYVQAEQRKGSPMLTAHVAIQTTAGFVGPNGDAKALEAAKAFVQQRSNDLRRQLVQQEITNAEKGLRDLNYQRDALQREKERAEASIVKCDERSVQAAQDQVKHKAEAAELKGRITAFQNDLSETPDPESQKELDRMIKDAKRADNDLAKAIAEEDNMGEKSKELTLAIKKNVEEQAALSTSITRQETLLKDLEEKRSAIH